MAQEDKTIWLKPPVPVLVKVEKGTADRDETRFTDSFKIGRDKSCQMQFKDAAVSRFHVEVRFDGEKWHIHDLQSSNGTFLDGNRIENAPLDYQARLELGRGGPVLWLRKEGAAKPKVQSRTEPVKPKEPVSETQIINRYFNARANEEAGDHTMSIRRAFERVHKKQSRKYQVLIVFVLILLAGAGGVVAYQQIKLNRLKTLSEDMFYTMKSLEIQVAQVEEVVLSTASLDQKTSLSSKRAQLKDMEKNYEKFLEEMDFYHKTMSEEDQMIFKVARIFGECEVNMPKGFVVEVRNYIRKWKSSGRLERAIHRAAANGYGSRISEEMLSNHLPPQFFYLGLQESDFNDHSVGPRTKFGIAKGIWQFLPTTAVEYGLHTGPLIEMPRFDPRDERYEFNKATRAASRYIKNIYNTQAQASGLLVMASYNWGENNIRQIIDRMPANPRERNFWRLLEKYKIPNETYDYVFYTFSAAVIGENPRFFGFDFENPLPKMG